VTGFCVQLNIDGLVCDSMLSDRCNYFLIKIISIAMNILEGFERFLIGKIESNVKFLKI
jgi:hypothetical protein